MQVGTLIKYKYSASEDLGVVVAIEKRPLDAHGLIYKIQWVDAHPLVKRIKYLKLDALVEVA